MTANILGTEYQILYRKESEDKYLADCNGYCDPTDKTIVILSEPHKEDDVNDFSVIKKKTLRHEILHAFLDESGLASNSLTVCMWAKNEEMVDWFAIQSPKIYEVYRELEIL